MGFAHEGCRKAVYHTHNSGVEAAMAWILEHMEDADFSDPLLLGPQSSSTASGVIESLMFCLSSVFACLCFSLLIGC